MLSSPFFFDSLLVSVSGLSDYFSQLLTSAFLLCKFWGLLGSTPVSFPVYNEALKVSWNEEIVSAKYSSTSPGKRAEKLAEAKADVKRVMQNPGRVCFILNQKR